MDADHRRLLPHHLCAACDGADDVLPVRRHRSLRASPAPDAAAADLRSRRGADAMTPVLQVERLCKSFGGITAVNDVSFDVREGEILGIIGPNGSGKSTMFNCVLGQLRPSSGEGRVDGQVTTGMRPCDLNRTGGSSSFRVLQVFAQLSVRDSM